MTIQGLEVRLCGSGAHRATILGSLRLILGPPLAGQVLGGHCPGCIQYSYKQATMNIRVLSAEERPAFQLWSSAMTPSSESLGQMWVGLRFNLHGIFSSQAPGIEPVSPSSRQRHEMAHVGSPIESAPGCTAPHALAAEALG